MKRLLNRFSEHLAIKERHEGRTISYRELAEEIGVGKATIGRYLRNESQQYDSRVVSSICTYLGIEPDQFFTWIDVSEGSTEDTEESALLAIPA